MGRTGYAAQARAENLPLRRSRACADSPGERCGAGSLQAGLDCNRAVRARSGDVDRSTGGGFARADGPGYRFTESLIRNLRKSNVGGGLPPMAEYQSTHE